MSPSVWHQHAVLVNCLLQAPSYDIPFAEQLALGTHAKHNPAIRTKLTAKLTANVTTRDILYNIPHVQPQVETKPDMAQLRCKVCSTPIPNVLHALCTPRTLEYVGGQHGQHINLRRARECLKRAKRGGLACNRHVHCNARALLPAEQRQAPQVHVLGAQTRQLGDWHQGSGAGCQLCAGLPAVQALPPTAMGILSLCVPRLGRRGRSGR